MKFLQKKNMYLFLIFPILLFMTGCWKTEPQEVSIKLNPQQKFQIISGWEATAQAAQYNSRAFDKYKEKLFDDAVNNLGINRLRIELKSGAENPTDYFSSFKAGQINEKELNQHRYESINDNDDPFVMNPNGFQFSQLDSNIENVVLPIKKLLENRNEKLYLNLNFVDFDKDRGVSSFRFKDNPEEYAELILAAYQHMQSKFGFVPDAVEVILEPDNNTGWTGTKIGQAIVATAKRLKENNFKPAFIAPSTTNADNAPIYIDEIAAVPNAMQFITEFSYHRYTGRDDKTIQKIADRAKKYNKQTSMLEWIKADYQTLHTDLKIGNNSAWQQYTLAFNNVPDNGAQYYLVDDKDINNPKVSLGSRTKFFRQYFYYIRSGAQRIGASSSNPGFDPLAFINANNKYVLVVKAESAGNFTIEGLPAGVYGITYTTESEANISAQDLTIKDKENLKANIPDKGVITIYSKG